MSQEEFYLFNELFSSNFGICFPLEKKEILESRLKLRLRALNLQHFHEYYLLVKFRLNGTERACMIRDVVNHETHFFRQPSQLQAIFSDLQMIKDNLVHPETLRLLVAGCSSGEEAYTLRILAFENSLKMHSLAPHIDAFDIDLSRVESAINAEYGAHSVRGVSEEHLQRYFQPAAGNHFKVRAPYRKDVYFSHGNILELGSFRKKMTYDVVVCRNVFIYFSEESIILALENFARCLNPGGLLLLGYSESVIGLSKYFEPVRLGGYILYKRTEDRMV